MKECIYNNDKMEYRTMHEICKNEEMKKINHSENDIPCMGKNCGMFKRISTNNDYIKSK